MSSSVDRRPCPHRDDAPCSVCVEVATLRSDLAISRQEVARLRSEVATLEAEVASLSAGRLPLDVDDWQERAIRASAALRAG